MPCQNRGWSLRYFAKSSRSCARTLQKKLPFRDGDASAALEQVLEIERVVEEIIRTSQLIGQALNEGRTDDARNALEQFKNSGFADSFNALIIAAMADQTFEPPSEDREASELIQAVAEWAPVLMTGLVVIIFLLNLVLSRRTIHSVSALHDGALALRSGDLSHRIPKLSDKEFQRLGATFNAMAIRLSEQREQLRDTNVQLEVMVDDRTRQLQETNKKLANADLSRRKLLADISHEFRTPLTVIRGEAEIAIARLRQDQEGLPGLLPTHRQTSSEFNTVGR